MSPLAHPPNPYMPDSTPPQPVVITDINVSIGTMCRFMVKWAIASVPAAILFWMVMLIVGVTINLVGSVLHRMFGPGHF